jgi:hypothetical protein
MSDFWSRRKNAVAEEQRRDAQALEAQEIAEHHAALEEKTDAEILEELGLPDPDTLVQGDDFSVFLQKAVPDRIKRVALRKLWLSNPVLANVDGLVDYGQDFTDAGVGAGVVETTYQVGKGMLAHVQEMIRQAEAEAAKDLEADEAMPLEVAMDQDENAQTDVEQTDDAPHESPVFIDASDDENTTIAADDQETFVAPRARKMRFTFADTAEC